jgi:hypothetical protein
MAIGNQDTARVRALLARTGRVYREPETPALPADGPGFVLIEGDAADTVKPTGLTAVSGFTARIKVTGPGSIEIPPTAATLGTNELDLPATASSGNFEDEIDYLNPMNLTWEVEVNAKSHWCEAGDTGHRTYVTLAVPATTMRQETIFDLGSRNGDGESMDAPAVAAIWTDFTPDSDEDASVEGFGVQFIKPPGLSADFKFWTRKLDTKGTQEVTTP